MISLGHSVVKKIVRSTRRKQHGSLSFVGGTIASLVKHRELIWQMALRDFKGLNKGAFLGVLWLVINPLVQVAAYVFIVSFVFKTRLSNDATTLDYAMYVLSGMVSWQLVTKSLQEAPSLLRDRMELVKQVIYPIETLPLTSFIVSSAGSLVTLVIYLCLAIATGGIHWTVLLLPLPMMILVGFVIGISWLFSIVGVLFKDLREIVSVGLGLLVYFSPVVLSQSMVGSHLWHYVLLNPLTHIVICFRDVLRSEFHPWSWVTFIVLSLICYLLGGYVMVRAKLLINEYI